ncbi:MAG: type II toxin-antitoxin system HicB family antitoxin [Rhodospirillales bacterium]|nr:type II toxin-antitoxin system HicB family antitoxin [Rhodospirillales bacterium]
MNHYIALIHKEPDSDFGVSFPDFPGCVSAGSTLDEAMTMAAEALELHVEGLLALGEAIPEPSTVDAVMADPANRDGVAALVPVPQARAKAVRVNITLPEDVLREIDAKAEREGYSRSGFIAWASRKAIGDAA